MTADFQIITKEQFEGSDTAASDIGEVPASPNEGAGIATANELSTGPLEWCEFCKGNYDPRYHYGDQEGGE